MVTYSNNNKEKDFKNDDKNLKHQFKNEETINKSGKKNYGFFQIVKAMFFF